MKIERQSDTAAAPLPALREELQLRAGAPTSTGAPTWLIFDPFPNRYYQIDTETYEVLSLWSEHKSIEDLRRAVATRYDRDVSQEAIRQLARFLEQSDLVVEAEGGWRTYAHRAAQSKHGWLLWLVHNYLFVRIPLLRPDSFLKATLPFASFFFTRTWLAIVAILTTVGLYLTSRQWDAFISTFEHFFSAEGIAYYAVTLCLVKALHELGHAYVAVRFGCRVPTMGIAMLVMMPMLYTDVTDAWKLQSRRQRLLIDAGGIIVELMVAGIATFLWAFLPEGPARSAAFLVATTSWIMSLALNLSPLMRFDGYFILADLVGIPNLQHRANALGRWKLRELLFGLGETIPEMLPARTVAWMIAYAWLIWIYRLVVFTGIALIVYHMFFKVLGLILFAVEIVWFIGKPVAAELNEWWKRRAAVRMQRRSAITAAVSFACLLLVIVPWSGRVTIPAVIEPAEFARLFPMTPGQITALRMRPGQQVAAGDVLVETTSPKLLYEFEQTKTRLALLLARQDRRISDTKDRLASLSLEQEIEKQQKRRDGLAKEIEQLKIRAPISGVVAELPPEIHEGRWLGRNDEIGVIVSSKGYVARGYLHQSDLGRLDIGTRGTFSFEHPLRWAVAVEVDRIAYSGTQSIDIAELASVYGGLIAAQETKERSLTPKEAHFLVTLATKDRALSIDHVMRGVVHLSGKPESILAAAWRQTLKVLVRESGA